jgi:hypothetical protein
LTAVRSAAEPPAATDRLTDLFWQAEKLPSSGEWRVRFEMAVLDVMRLRNLPRAEAEKAAYENVVIEFLNATHPNTLTDRCVWCGKLEEPGAALQPIGWGARHVWLHSDCWASWREHRCVEAIAGLAAMRIMRPPA